MAAGRVAARLGRAEAKTGPESDRLYDRGTAPRIRREPTGRPSRAQRRHTRQFQPTEFLSLRGTATRAMSIHTLTIDTNTPKRRPGVR